MSEVVFIHPVNGRPTKPMAADSYSAQCLRIAGWTKVLRTTPEAYAPSQELSELEEKSEVPAPELEALELSEAEEEKPEKIPDPKTKATKGR